MGDSGGETDQIRNIVTALSLQAQAPGGRQSTTGGSRPRITAPNDNSSPTVSSSASMSPRPMTSQTSSTPPRRTVSVSTASDFPVPAFLYSPTSPPRQPTRFADEHHAIVSGSPLPTKKDEEDPNSPEDAISPNGRREFSTPSALSRLLASEVTTPPTQPRELSYQ